MKTNRKILLLGIVLTALPMQLRAKNWTLKACIDYALQHNIALKKNLLAKKTAWEDLKESQAALLPSLSLSTSQNVSYTPWPETGSAVVAGTKVQTSVDKVYYNGSYALNANWTVWNGNRNRNQVKLNSYAARQAELDSATTANTLTEQIAQLFVQILYSDEAIKVNQESLSTSTKNEERGKEMLAIGKMSKADLAQLTAQRAQDEYAIVQAESHLKDYKRQLKQLLQLTDEAFDVIVPETTDEMAMELIPNLNAVYEQAVANRPEIKNAKLAIESSELSIKMAQALRMPTVGLSAGFSTNTTSMNKNTWNSQMRNNLVLGGGVTISVPLFDNRQAKTSINKARIQRAGYLLDLQDKQTTLYSTIENYWLQANNNQRMFRSAQVSSLSAKESYTLLSEQFRLGLKNIVELMTGKDNLLKARQNELQSKYLAILNINLLKFYQNGVLK